MEGHRYEENLMLVALITGGSAGLGKALADALADHGWNLVIDARRAARLDVVVAELSKKTKVIGLSGNVADPRHRAELAAAVTELGRLDLLVNNASTLGPTPLPPLAVLPLDGLRQVYEVNVVAPLALTQLLIVPLTGSEGAVLNISSDAAVASYPGWGAYGSAKAALDHLTATLAVEHPSLRCYAVDPGDLRTELHQAAFPGEDISDRPLPESVVPALLELVDRRTASGRYQAADLAVAATTS
jgi:NAD(P)-dependent dehydrogenase (short-subunit alcohol dehydrogenase family)